MTAVVAELHQRGVGFEQVDLAGLCTAGGIAEVARPRRRFSANRGSR